MESMIAEKAFDQLVHAVALLKEMVHMVITLAESPMEIQQTMSFGLQVSTASTSRGGLSCAGHVS